MGAALRDIDAEAPTPDLWDDIALRLPGLDARREAEVVSALFLAGCGATVVLGLYGVLGGDAFFGFPAHSWAAFAGAAIVSQIAGVLGIIWALRWLPPTSASVALLAQPVGTTLLGWWLLDEALGPVQALGAAAVLAGIALAAAAQQEPRTD